MGSWASVLLGTKSLPGFEKQPEIYGRKVCKCLLNIAMPRKFLATPLSPSSVLFQCTQGKRHQTLPQCCPVKTWHLTPYATAKRAGAAWEQAKKIPWAFLSFKSNKSQAEIQRVTSETSTDNAGVWTWVRKVNVAQYQIGWCLTYIKNWKFMGLKGNLSSSVHRGKPSYHQTRKLGTCTAVTHRE